MEIDSHIVFELPSMVDPTSGFEGGEQLARQLASGKAQFTAVLAFDDLTALGVVRGLHSAGVRVPEDCSVVGFDDVLPAAVSTPAITTIRQPLDEMGRAAARLLVETLAERERGEKKSAAQIHMSAPVLVVRQSSAAPAERKGKGRKK